MSTLAYAAMTRKREEAKSGTSTTTNAPGVSTYFDALAALVPAEVLTAHAAILTFTTNTVTDAAGNATVTITEAHTLGRVFYALIALSIALYAVGRLMVSKWDNWDWLRVLIPPAAFVGWTMLQKATAFDAVAPTFGQAGRSATAIIGAIILGLLAAALAYKADQKSPD